MKLSLLPICACLLASLGQSRAASIFSETFSNSGDTANWFEVADSPDATLDQEPVSGVLRFAGSAASIFYVAADASSSGGAFSGDYSAAGISGISFDLQLEPGSVASSLLFEITNLSEDETWQYALTLAQDGTVQHYFVPIPADGSGWTQTTGDQSFSFLLSQVEEVGISLSNNQPGTIAGSIDNVSTVPEPASVLLVSVAGLVTISRRRR